MHHHQMKELTEQPALLVRQVRWRRRLELLERLQVVHGYRHRASRAPLRSLPEWGRRSSSQRSSWLQPSWRAWELRWILRPLRRSLNQETSPSTCAPQVLRPSMMLIERIRLLLEAWRAVPYFLNLNLLLTRKRGPLPQLPSVSKAPAKFAEA